MRKRDCKENDPKISTAGMAACLGLAILLTAGCQEPDNDEGTVVTATPLPTDTLLNLACADVAIFTETCVLDDPENPYVYAVINEFNENDPEAETKFDLAAEIPAGPTGAKARFYLWATALARRPSGENQWYVAQALHELFDANEDELIREQALRAYRSVLDNFFSSVTFFECCGGVAFSANLNELVADNLYRPASLGFVPLIPGGELFVLERLSEWGYTYQPANPPNYDDGVISVNDG